MYTDHIHSLHDSGQIRILPTPYALQCYHREAWELETNIGTEWVDTSIADTDPKFFDSLYEIDEANGTKFQEELFLHVFGDYVEGSEIHSGEKVSHWVTCWTMPGYMDMGEECIGQTEAESLSDWLHRNSEDDSFTADGDGILNIPDSVFSAIDRLAELADEWDEIAIQTLKFFELSPILA